MTSILKSCAFLVCLFIFINTSQSQAQQSDATPGSFVQEENAEERINYSGKLRMLSQRIPSAACHLARGIDVEGAKTLLIEAPAEFEKILTALEFGDPDLNIQHPEMRRKTLERIHELRAEWEPMQSAAQKIVDGTASEDEVNFVLTQNMKVLGVAVRLVPELVKQYSNPNAVPFSQLLLIDISGRQRMLTQKISKESCMMGTVYNTPETPDNLTNTIAIFEASLEALQNGLPELSLLPPPNATISEGLEVVSSDWNRVKPLLDEVQANKDLGDVDNAEKFQGLNITMSNMNKVVGMYAKAAKSPS